jgi:arginine exporter protein ArgO
MYDGLYVVVMMIAVVVGVDLLFLRNPFWERTIVNIGIVFSFVALPFRFLRHP